MTERMRRVRLFVAALDPYERASRRIFSVADSDGDGAMSRGEFDAMKDALHGGGRTVASRVTLTAAEGYAAPSSRTRCAADATPSSRTPQSGDPGSRAVFERRLRAVLDPGSAQRHFASQRIRDDGTHAPRSTLRRRARQPSVAVAMIGPAQSVSTIAAIFVFRIMSNLTRTPQRTRGRSKAARQPLIGASIGLIYDYS